MEGEQLRFENLFASSSNEEKEAKKTEAKPAVASSSPATNSPPRAAEQHFLNDAALLMQRWKVPTNIAKLALGILNNGN